MQRIHERVLPVVVLIVGLLAASSRGEEAEHGSQAHRGTVGPPIPIILDTDIGGDIDDTWALVMLLKSPELDCKLITTCTGDTTYRAKVAAKLLELAGRTHIPIGIGPARKGGSRPQGEWVTGYDLSSYPGPVHSDGAGALVDAVMSAPEPLTIVAIGPFTTVAEALRREPRIARRSRIVAMAGNIRKPFGDATGAIPEYNVKIDVPASKAVFTAPWEMTITPLDTCGFVRLEGDAYRSILNAEDPLIRALMENYRLWCRFLGRDDWWPERSSILFDTVAVRLAFSEEHLAMEDLKLTVEDDGLTAVSPEGRPVRTATEWADQDAYEAFLVDRLIHGTH